MCNIRLGTTEASLTNGYLVYSHRLPEPSIMIYNDHSARAAKADGGQARRGFLSASLQFDQLTFWQLRTLWKLVDDAAGSADELMYATVAEGWNGSGGWYSWIDVKGRAHYPNASPVGGSSNKLYDNVILTINNLTIVNDPASF